MTKWKNLLNVNFVVVGSEALSKIERKNGLATFYGIVIGYFSFPVRTLVNLLFHLLKNWFLLNLCLAPTLFKK